MAINIDQRSISCYTLKNHVFILADLKSFSVKILKNAPAVRRFLQSPD
jgi:hypothetical protein